MTNSIDGFQGLNAFNTMSAYKNMGKIKNEFLNENNGKDFNLDTKQVSDVKYPESPVKLEGYISQNNLSTDSELSDDLKLLLKTNDTSNIQNGYTPDDAAKTFQNVLGNYINDVNQTSKTAENAIETFASGGNIDLHSVMIASEKSSLAMQLTMQMKNKILQAYQEISRLQV